MAGKRFPGSMFGFNKKMVNTYIENLIRDYEEKLTSKDIEIEKVIKQLKSVTAKYEELKLEEETIRTEKEKITGALVRANEMAERIVGEAKEKVAAEVTELEAAAEREREKIVDIRKQLMRMKADAAAILKNYSRAVEEIAVEADESEEEEPVEEAAVEEAAEDAEEDTDDFFS